MKRAKILCSAVWVNCPCGGSVTNPDSGSYVWEITQVNSTLTGTCDTCDAVLEVRLGKSVAVRI